MDHDLSLSNGTTGPRQPLFLRIRFLLFCSVFLFVAALAALPLDMPVVRFASQLKLRGDIARLFGYCEVFGHGIGVALIILTVTVLDQRRFRCSTYLVIYAYGAGLVAAGLKLLVSRTRPYHLIDLSVNVGETVSSWLPTWNGQELQANTSFPSGHTATAIGLAIGLGTLYPRGQYLFLTFAGLAALQRIASLAHYPSDVLGGATVAFFLGTLLACRWSLTSKMQINESQSAPEPAVTSAPWRKSA